jgi:hypothetical protein
MAHTVGYRTDADGFLVLRDVQPAWPRYEWNVGYTPSRLLRDEDFYIQVNSQTVNPVASWLVIEVVGAVRRSHAGGGRPTIGRVFDEGLVVAEGTLEDVLDYTLP